MSHKKILVAEDDDPIRELLTIRLGVAGYHVVEARSGGEALTQIAAYRPAGMVLDIGLPVMDGFAVLAALASRNLAIPTLVLTARNKSDDVERALSLGAWDFMSKPFDHKVLIARVGRMFEADRKRLNACFL